MAPYEPKIDSREFEVANADHPSAWAGETRADVTEVAFRLWAKRSNRSTPLTWNTENSLVYLITDLVGASGGRVSESGLAAMAAQFDSASVAMVTAKRIQTSILEFAACRPGERIGAAVLIYKPRSSELTGYSSELVQLALEKAKPGQILVAENVSDRLRELPATKFRPVTAAKEDEQSGMAELMWTTPEKLADLQKLGGDDDRSSGVGSQAADVERGDIPPLGATRIVHSPIARREATKEIVPPVAGTGNLIVKQVGGTASQRTGQIPNVTQDRGPAFGRFEESPSRAFTDGLDEFGDRPLFTRNRIIVGIVALVLVAATVAVVFRPTSVAKRPIAAPQPQQDQIVGTETPGKQPSAGTESTDRTAQPEQTTVTPQLKVPVATTPAQTPKKKPDNRKGKIENADEPPVPPPVVDGFTQKDVPNLLSMAQRDFGAGRYGDAKIEFKKVLALQPGNQEAKEGLHRIDLIPTDQQ